jgi:small-conductance mechanosensitive channel
MQDSLAVAAALIYAGAVIHAWRVLPGAGGLKFQRTLLFPGLFLIASFVAVLAVPALRGAISRHLLISYRTGFGQSVISVLVGVGVIVVVAGFIFWQVHGSAHGGRYPGGVFSGYAAGIGLLLAQTVIVRRLEKDPALQREIESR